jgi:voltage-gated potassium channel
LGILPIVGTVGFHLIERWSLFDSLYMSVITLTTVGYMEVHPLSSAGRLFVIVYLIAGLGIFYFSIVQLGERIVRLELRDWMERRRMETIIRSMSNHFVICGCGRMGESLIRQLEERRLKFVIVENDPAILEKCLRNGWLSVSGDATDDKTLLAAGLDRARGLAAVLSSDADNLFVVLSARLLSKEVFIVSRAVDDASVNKFVKAGDNRVISLFGTSASRMAQFLTNPNLEEVFQMFHDAGSGLEVAEIHVPPSSPWAGQRLDQTDFGKRGVMIIGIRRANNELVLPPPSSSVIQPDDHLIAWGRSEDVASLIKM